MKHTITASLLSLGLLAGAAFAQEGTNKQDITVSALGSFQRGTTGNGIDQTGENSAGVLFSYRYFFTNHQGVELNYGFSRFDQNFTSLNTTAPAFAPLGVSSNTNEATASYVYRFGVHHRLTPFVSAGTGALLFVPNSFATGSTFATPDFVYGAGADIAVSRKVSLRLGYRGHVFEAPDFGVAGLNTGSVTHMAEPFGGLSFHF